MLVTFYEPLLNKRIASQSMNHCSIKFENVWIVNLSVFNQHVFAFNQHVFALEQIIHL